MTEYTKCNEAIEKILDMVSSRETTQDWVKGKQITYDIRWGHDTDCGNADNIQKDALKILKEYGVVQ